MTKEEYLRLEEEKELEELKTTYRTLMKMIASDGSLSDEQIEKFKEVLFIVGGKLYLRCG